ncbi:MAG: L-serine ammonia-lyase [Acidimicrobiales bacterium]|jgi:L-serine dehydratase
MTVVSDQSDIPDRRVRSTISVFDMLKVGIGPSSSHTLGPWRAALRFLDELDAAGELATVIGIAVDLFGSLAKTGRGHGTGVAIMMGLRGEDPETCEVDLVTRLGHEVLVSGELSLGGHHTVPFVRDRDIRFNADRSLDFHPNGMALTAVLANGEEFVRRYFSVGGGFVVGEDKGSSVSAPVTLPCPIERASDLLRWTEELDCSIADVVRRNERFWRTDDEIDAGLTRIWDAMVECMYRGCCTEGVLPGGLEVTRRAAVMHQVLMGSASDFGSAKDWFASVCEARPHFDHTVKWVSCFALAVNEENAAFGRVVTAPTNGAAGVVPAVLAHFLATGDGNPDGAIRFLMVAAEIGAIFKKRSTISAAMGGCQAEIGVSSSMAAAALVEGRGGSPAQALMAAEIAMEHHLGLTCDPIGGLVQIPCIERNAMGAMKAITAAHMALAGMPDLARVTLDDVIDTMWETAQDMSSKYKETSEGGLAVRIPVRIIEC